ncbi:MAG: MATE family efflux transporter, partial [Duodenibacillus sp.]|nr:MATE family efflux transporter [Duodenibacillus sp.]
NFERCMKVTKVGMLLMLAGNLAVSVLAVVFARPLLAVFNTDPAVIELGLIRVLYIVIPGPVNCGIEGLSAVLRGFGHSMPPALAALICICGVRIAYVWTAFAAWPSFKSLMLVYPVSWVATLALLSGIFIVYMRRVKAQASAQA